MLARDDVTSFTFRYRVTRTDGRSVERADGRRTKYSNTYSLPEPVYFHMPFIGDLVNVVACVHASILFLLDQTERRPRETKRTRRVSAARYIGK